MSYKYNYTRLSEINSLPYTNYMHMYSINNNLLWRVNKQALIRYIKRENIFLLTLRIIFQLKVCEN